MGLFNRTAGARVTVTPEVVRPRQAVTATVVTDKPLDKVGSARLEWGYDNFYRHRWAGRADSAAAAGNDTLLTAGQVGTNYGGERDTDDWVCVDRIDVPIAAGEFAGTTASFTVPSWAPGSSPQLARWGCRLVVERGGRDVDTRGDFTVVLAAPTRASSAGTPSGAGRRAGWPNHAAGQEDSVACRRPVRVALRVAAAGRRGPFRRSGALVGVVVCRGQDVYSGFTGHQVERVRRPIVVVNAP